MLMPAIDLELEKCPVCINDYDGVRYVCTPQSCKRHGICVSCKAEAQYVNYLATNQCLCFSRCDDVADIADCIFQVTSIYL